MQSVHIATEQPIARPRFVWIAVVIEFLTALTAIPVGWILMSDPSGAGIQLPPEWIQGSPFGNYFVPGLYLFAMNGFGMLIAAALTLIRHWSAPWLTAILGVGLIVWITVQLLLMPEVMWLQPVFMAAGIVLGFVSLFWLRETRQLRLW
jgi:hypothetical protein